ncbi:MAG: hypothetical protein ABJB66_10805, partial [Gemmatimonadaceae bacterium]
MLNYRKSLFTVARWLILVRFSACNLDDCGPDGRTTNPVINFGHLELLVSPQLFEMLPGETVRTTVTGAFTLVSGASLTLGATPPGITGSFSPTVITPGVTSTLTLIADANAKPSSPSIEVLGAEYGSHYGGSARVLLNFKILKPFVLSRPDPQSITMGTTRDFTFGVTRTQGFNKPISLSVVQSSIPAGATATLSQQSLTSDQPTFTLKIDAPLGTPTPGFIRVVGEYGASTDTSVLTLNVLAVPVPSDFSATATPNSASIAPGASATFDLTYTRSDVSVGSIT